MNLSTISTVEKSLSYTLFNSFNFTSRHIFLSEDNRYKSTSASRCYKKKVPSIFNLIMTSLN
jgi:hypothetical protein